MQVFLDSDGVLADFDTYAASLLGMKPREWEASKGKKSFWGKIYADPDFFFNLPKMHDADELVEGVRGLGFEPIVLTGIPSQDGSDWAIDQKTRWYAKHYPDLRVITCKSKNKFQHMVEGKHNVLIDDWEQHKHVWEDAGGTFIVHTSTSNSLRQLQLLVDERYWDAKYAPEPWIDRQGGSFSEWEINRRGDEFA